MKNLDIKKLLGILAAFVVVLVLGVLFVGNSEEELSSPPSVVIDSGYNATLSGSPYYFVTEDDEDMYDESLDVCDRKGDNGDRLNNQNGWYRLVAWEDDLTVGEIVFSQVELREDDPAVIFYYNSEDQTFEAQPNKILRNADGSRLPELDLDKKLQQGEVVVITSSRSADFCVKYEEASPHVNVHEGWNLIAKPDFERIDYRAIWEVALAKGGNSGVLPDKYFPTSNNNFDAADLSDEDLYWVYVGSGGVIDPGGQPADDQEVVLKHNGSVIDDGDQFEINEKDGVFDYTLGLKNNADEKIELEFELVEKGQVISSMRTATEVLSSSTGTSVVTGISFEKGEKDPASLLLSAIDDSETGDEIVEFRVKDKAGKLPTRNFKLKIVDDEALAEKDVRVLVIETKALESDPNVPIEDVDVVIKGTSTNGKTGADGKLTMKTTQDSVILVLSKSGYKSQEVTASDLSSEILVVLEKENVTPVEGAKLEVKTAEIAKGDYLLVGPVDASKIKDVNLGKFSIDKKVTSTFGQVTYTPVGQGDALEFKLENGNNTDGYTDLKLKLKAGDWDENSEYRISFSRQGVNYVGDSFNVASVGEFKVKEAAASGLVSAIDSFDKPIFTIGSDEITESGKIVIDQIYEIAGRGTVIEGTVMEGTVKVDETVVVVCANGSENGVLVSEIIKNDQSVTSASQGDSVGILLRGVSAADLGCENTQTVDNYGPALTLMTPRIKTTDKINVQINDGYAIDSLCAAGDVCTLTKGGKVYDYSSVDGLHAQTSLDGLISWSIRSSSQKANFEIGEYILKIEGAEYKNGEKVPNFKGVVTVVNSYSMDLDSDDGILTSGSYIISLESPIQGKFQIVNSEMKVDTAGNVYKYENLRVDASGRIVFDFETNDPGYYTMSVELAEASDIYLDNTVVQSYSFYVRD